MNSLSFIILVAVVTSSVCAQDVSESNGKLKTKIPVKIAREGEDLGKIDDVFVPTNEWQPVKPGQTVPRGLHIRMNSETGNVEAKLLEPDGKEETSNSALVHVKQDEEEEAEEEIEESKSPFNPSELKELLKKMKDDGASAEEVKKEKYRSYEEIKQDLADLRFSVKTDYEIMTQLISQFKNFTEASDIAAVLRDLEYYIHQYDNALDFVQLGGFRDLVLPSLNSTSDELRSAAAFLLGSAAQSNPKVQIAALEVGLIPQLLRLIAHDPSFKVRSSALYAISCITRRFPLAQQELVSQGGISELARIFESSTAEALKLQLKVITLVSDFIVERKELERQEKTDKKAEVDLLAEKKRQYQAVDLEQSLVEQGFCRLVTRLLGSLNGDNLAEKHDLVEKVLQAMMSFSASCRNEFYKSFGQLQRLESTYKNLSLEELAENNGSIALNDSYYTGLLSMCETLLKSLGTRDEL